MGKDVLGMPLKQGRRNDFFHARDINCGIINEWMVAQNAQRTQSQREKANPRLVEKWLVQKLRNRRKTRLAARLVLLVVDIFIRADRFEHDSGRKNRHNQ